MTNLILNNNFLEDIKTLVKQGKTEIARTINRTISTTYWYIGKRINEEILQNSRAEYGKEIVKTLSHALTLEFGKGWSEKHLRHCLRFSETFQDFQIVSELQRQLSWTHFKSIMYLKDDLQRDFYAQLSIMENWSTTTLQKKINSMLFERTAISKKPQKLAEMEIGKLRKEDQLTPDLVFRDHYVLDFLNLKDTFLEKDLESAILKEIENFLLELGGGFSFVARQKRMLIDDTDYYLDLLFYHRKLKSLVAIELKIGRFKASYKGQMELYLRYLEKYETEKDENPPIGLILCAEGNQEQVELLQLDKANIRVAEYITEYLPKELLEKKLHEFAQIAKKILQNKKAEIKNG
ncbi:MAG: cytoplasmic protein [Tenericutes bacterium 4572_104]|nr:MAG: cytoplasmic protein [Tenericutes bacterium 4572_104]